SLPTRLPIFSSLESGFSSSTMLLPPRFTFFPYTTLFRSLRPWLFEEAVKGTDIALILRMHERYDHSYYFISTFMEDHLKWHAERDRKSTRLNSSHVKISYAVFCLKKEN